MRPPEEVKRHIVRQWLRKAEADMDAAEALLSEERPVLYPSCFHSQQAAEKLMKAFLTWHQIEFPKTHILGELLDLIAEVDEELAMSMNDATALNPYGVETRYPGDIPEPSLEQAEEALALARKVADAIMKRLKEVK